VNTAATQWQSSLGRSFFTAYTVAE
jgi:hypothetical protein